MFPMRESTFPLDSTVSCPSVARIFLPQNKNGGATQEIQLRFVGTELIICHSIGYVLLDL